MDIPREILHIVLGYCDGKSFYRLRQTCREMAGVSDDEYFSLFRDDDTLRSPRIATIFETYCEVRMRKIEPMQVVRYKLATALYLHFVETRQNFKFYIYPKVRRGPSKEWSTAWFTDSRVKLEVRRNNRVRRVDCFINGEHYFEIDDEDSFLWCSKDDPYYELANGLIGKV
nr:hypothetical protein K-LCC10_0056 [Kaumoebavirus]